jgi:cobalt-zinc-cadmium efflux system outer membrane protein
VTKHVIAQIALLFLVTPSIPLASSARAQSVSLDEIVRMAREASPRARALRASQAVREADVAVAGVYPNPELSYVFMGRFDGSNQAINGTQHQAWMDIPLLIVGQHDARRGAAAALATAERAELELSLLGLEVEARRAFVALLAAQDRLARLEAGHAELEGLGQIIRERAAAGAQSRYDGARIDLELARVDTELASARAELGAARTQLAAIVGRAGWEPEARGTLESLRTELPPPDALPRLEAMELRVEAAQRDVERAERERVPEIRLGLGTYLTSDPDSASIYAGITVPLPIFDTGDAAVSRARAARDAAIEARGAVEHEVRARLQGRLAVLRARREALDRFDRTTGAQLPALAEMAEASYRLGSSGVFELIDSFRVRFELELARIELVTEIIDAETDVLAATGAR